MRLLLLLSFIVAFPAQAGWIKKFCEKHLIADAEDYTSTELTDLFAIECRGNALLYAQRLEELYVKTATDLIWSEGTNVKLQKRLKKIGNELRKIDPDCPVLRNFRIYEDELI